ncbi:unnamed protein product, partial [Heterotrigona itama]
ACLIPCESTDIRSIPNGIANKFFQYIPYRREYQVKEETSRYCQVLQQYRVCLVNFKTASVDRYADRYLR